MNAKVLHCPPCFLLPPPAPPPPPPPHRLLNSRAPPQLCMHAAVLPAPAAMHTLTLLHCCSAPASPLPSIGAELDECGPSHPNPHRLRLPGNRPGRPTGQPHPGPHRPLRRLCQVCSSLGVRASVVRVRVFVVGRALLLGNTLIGKQPRADQHSAQVLAVLCSSPCSIFTWEHLPTCPHACLPAPALRTGAGSMCPGRPTGCRWGPARCLPAPPRRRGWRCTPPPAPATLPIAMSPTATSAGGVGAGDRRLCRLCWLGAIWAVQVPHPHLPAQRCSLSHAGSSVSVRAGPELLPRCPPGASPPPALAASGAGRALRTPPDSGWLWAHPTGSLLASSQTSTSAMPTPPGAQWWPSRWACHLINDFLLCCRPLLLLPPRSTPPACPRCLGCLQDSVSNGKASCMRFTAGAWKNVGPPGFSPAAADFLSLAVGPSGPYVAFQASCGARPASPCPPLLGWCAT